MAGKFKAGRKKMMIQAKAEGYRSAGGWDKKLKKPEAVERKAPLDVYRVVTERILEKLEQGTVPWQSPSVARVGLPRNFSTGKVYRGINVFLLSMMEFQSPFFMTFIQAREMGGNVRKGEKGFPVIKMGTWEPKDGGEPKDRSGSGEGQGESEKRKFLRLYTVFNSSQIEGMEFPETEICAGYTELQQSEAARLIVEGMPNRPKINEGSKAHPHYVPATDTVEMPDRQTFRAEWRFFKTMYHELAHATGHASRLNRRTLVENRGMFSPGQEGRKIYCEEELVAEMTAAFLGAHAGIIEDDFENSASYLKGWMDVLQVKDHRTWLIKAASEAQKAVDYVLEIPIPRP